MNQRDAEIFADDAIEAVAQFVEALDRCTNPPKTYAELAGDIRRLKNDTNHRLPLGNYRALHS